MPDGVAVADQSGGDVRESLDALPDLEEGRRIPALASRSATRTGNPASARGSVVRESLSRRVWVCRFETPANAGDR